MANVNEIKKEKALEIINSIFNEGYTYLHDKKGGIIKPDVVLVRVIDGKVDICYANERCQYFSVNPFVIDDDGRICLSTCSIGGVVDLRNCVSLNDAVKNYNLKNSDRLTVVRKNESILDRELTCYIISKIG